MNKSRIAVIALVALSIVCVAVRPDRLIAIAAGAVSQNVCSGTFVSGLSPDTVYAQEMRAEGGMGLIDWALAYKVDRHERRVTTTVFGLFKTTSRFHEGSGCRIEHPGEIALGTLSKIAPPPLLPDIAGPEPVLPVNPKLADAMSEAFADNKNGAARFTRAVVIVHQGRIVGERYSPGIGLDTPLISHSIAKSVLNAMIGILVRDGKMRIDQKVSASAWKTPVTVDQLLRMDGGLPVDEGRGPGLAQRMWFLESDQAAFAQSTPLDAEPETKWAYSNLSYAVLSRLVREATGGSPEGVSSYMQRELFGPLGMRNATMEFDGTGSPMGSNAMFASARDWARFGLLYLNNGMAGTKRILPEGWVAYSTRRTLDSGYGAGFWLNVTDSPIPGWGTPWGIPGAPPDAYMARGYLGQYIVIVPSESLVVVRLGVDRSRGSGIDGIGSLVQSVIAALHR